jgi:hypothetical protein
MTIEELARQPIFTVSIVVCAFIITYAIIRFFSLIFRGTARVIANKSASPTELQSIELAGMFYEDLEQLIVWVVSIEKLSAELPGPFDDHSWIRLLELIDTLEVVREELNKQLHTSNYDVALPLGRYLTGHNTSVPTLSLSGGKQLQSVAHWQDTAENLVLRMISRIEDCITYGTGGNTSEISKSFLETLNSVKKEVLDDID